MLKEELKALKRVKRFRERKLYSRDLLDFASNDYLCLAHSKKSLKLAYKMVKKADRNAPKASMMVNGYHKIHFEFERKLCDLNGFDNGLLFSSGFVANLGVIEAMCRAGWVLYMDEEYHASGLLGSKLARAEVVFFKHNSPKDLRYKIEQNPPKKALIAIEGVYSMIGDIASSEFADIAKESGFLLLVDEAHSSGVIGRNLLGYFDFYDIDIEPNFIKLGTLGKAYGSSGAYILGSYEVITFLENRSKSTIYSTAPSLFDTALGQINVDKICKKRDKYIKRLKENTNLASDIFQKELSTPILMLEVSSSQRALEIQSELKHKGFLIGAIRPPTTKKPTLRVILREKHSRCKNMLERLSDVYL